MNLNETTIAKINSLPEDLLYEVQNFIDFIYIKHKIKSNDNIDPSLVESDMGQYLSQLNEYEELLVEGKIKW